MTLDSQISNSQLYFGFAQTKRDALTLPHPFPLQVIWAVREYARKAVDFLARRSRMSSLDVHACDLLLPRVVQLMGDELKWSKQRRDEETALAKVFPPFSRHLLSTCRLSFVKLSKSTTID